LLACLVAGCGPGPSAPPDPALVRLIAQAAPYGSDVARRLDVVADLSNPTPSELRGVYLRLNLVDGPKVTLELGDVPPLGEGHVWHPVRLKRPVGAEAFFGGPAEVVEREDASTLPKLWLVTRFESVTLGYRVEGEDRRTDVTEAVNERLAAWNRQVVEEAQGFRARAAEAVEGIRAGAGVDPVAPAAPPSATPR
jgi:hypothetical protein